VFLNPFEVSDIMIPWGVDTIRAPDAWEKADGDGVKVLNISFGDTAYNSTEAAVLHSAQESDDILIVAAAGNNSGMNHTVYPAALSDVLSVSGINSNKSFANPSTVCGLARSNYGPTIDLSAPFDNYTADGSDDDDYDTSCGTSFSSPMVAGVGALVRELAPGLSAFQVMQRLRYTGRDLGASGWDQYFGYGLVDAYNATGPCPLGDDLSLDNSRSR